MVENPNLPAFVKFIPVAKLKRQSIQKQIETVLQSSLDKANGLQASALEQREQSFAALRVRLKAIKEGLKSLNRSINKDINTEYEQVIGKASRLEKKLRKSSTNLKTKISELESAEETLASINLEELTDKKYKSLSTKMARLEKTSIDLHYKAETLDTRAQVEKEKRQKRMHESNFVSFFKMFSSPAIRSIKFVARLISL